jgi:hypothetical protein
MFGRWNFGQGIRRGKKPAIIVDLDMSDYSKAILTTQNILFYLVFLSFHYIEA